MVVVWRQQHTKQITQQSRAPLTIWKRADKLMGASECGKALRQLLCHLLLRFS
jgi:hypothetical protein